MKTENRGGFRKGAGRNIVSEHPRDKNINIRITDLERDQLRFNAKRNNQTMTEYILEKSL